jgi:hypothetical protein
MSVFDLPSLGLALAMLVELRFGPGGPLKEAQNSSGVSWWQSAERRRQAAQSGRAIDQMGSWLQESETQDGQDAPISGCMRGDSRRSARGFVRRRTLLRLGGKRNTKRNVVKSYGDGRLRCPSFVNVAHCAKKYICIRRSLTYGGREIHICLHIAVSAPKMAQRATFRRNPFPRNCLACCAAT